MVFIEQSHVRTRSGGINRRKRACAVCVDPSCYAQRTRLDVHRTLARVPTVCQNTADDNDYDARGRDHETNVPGHMPRDGGAVEAGNACPRARTTNAGALPGQKTCGNSVSIQMESKSPADDAGFSRLNSNPIGAARSLARPCDCRPLIAIDDESRPTGEGLRYMKRVSMSSISQTV